MRTELTDSSFDRYVLQPAARAAVSVALVAAAWGVSSLMPVGQPVSTQTPRATIDPMPARALEATALPAYIASRWSIDPVDARQLVALARRAAESHSLDPYLVLAVIARESSFRHNGNAGTLRAGVPDVEVNPEVAHGLMQVAGRYHVEKMPTDAGGRMRVTTAEENVDIGSRILREYLERDSGNVSRALQRYNGSLGDPEKRFSNYVLRVRDRFERAARATRAA